MEITWWDLILESGEAVIVNAAHVTHLRKVGDKSSVHLVTGERFVVENIPEEDEDNEIG